MIGGETHFFRGIGNIEILFDFFGRRDITFFAVVASVALVAAAAAFAAVTVAARLLDGFGFYGLNHFNRLADFHIGDVFRSQCLDCRRCRFGGLVVASAAFAVADRLRCVFRRPFGFCGRVCSI